ncbi:hypothetical protein ILYODFUR_007475 [Ilyodon furcidens]|uniref:Secreted protein n=1 Tax=Ilyodon furcidens TaxID=33524 RepID=A0ABV0TUF1_9TELE
MLWCLIFPTYSRPTWQHASPSQVRVPQVKQPPPAHIQLEHTHRGYYLLPRSEFRSGDEVEEKEAAARSFTVRSAAAKTEKAHDCGQGNTEAHICQDYTTRPAHNLFV